MGIVSLIAKALSLSLNMIKANNIGNTHLFKTSCCSMQFQNPLCCLATNTKLNFSRNFYSLQETQIFFSISVSTIDFRFNFFILLLFCLSNKLVPLAHKTIATQLVTFSMRRLRSDRRAGAACVQSVTLQWQATIAVAHCAHSEEDCSPH